MENQRHFTNHFHPWPQSPIKQKDNSLMIFFYYFDFFSSSFEYFYFKIICESYWFCSLSLRDFLMIWIQILLYFYLVSLAIDRSRSPMVPLVKFCLCWKFHLVLLDETDRMQNGYFCNFLVLFLSIYRSSLLIYLIINCRISKRCS